MRRVMLHQNQAVRSETAPGPASAKRYRRHRQRAGPARHNHLIGLGARNLQRCRDGLLRQLARCMPACDFLFFDRRDQFAVAQQGAAASLRIPPSPRMIIYLLSALLDFGPRVAQADGSVEHRLVRAWNPDPRRNSPAARTG